MVSTIGVYIPDGSLIRIISFPAGLLAPSCLSEQCPSSALHERIQSGPPEILGDCGGKLYAVVMSMQAGIFSAMNLPPGRNCRRSPRGTLFCTGFTEATSKDGKEVTCD